MSSTSIGQIGLDLVVNKKDFEKQISGVQRLAKKTGTILASAFAVKKITDFGKSCLQLGSDLSEVQNVVDVTFPSMTSKVDEFAKSAASGFGLSETMAKKFTGTFGAMAKAFGFSEQAAYDMGSTLTGLAGDVASFYNITQDEAYTKLKSVFTGETESLKDLGVVMTQSALDAYALANGFGKTTQQMSEAEKVALRYQFVQNQLSAAQGDFARTSGSWANQVRILKLQFDSLKATIGQGLINLFTPVIKVVNVLIGKLGTLANAFKAFTELLTGNKSSGYSTGQFSDMGAAAADAGTGMENAADGMSASAQKAGNAAKKAARDMRSLMGFDAINKLTDQSDQTSDSPENGSGTGNLSGALGSTVDFGNLAQGETVIEKTDKKLSALIKRCKELAAIFKKGFKIGFGDSEKKIASITKSLKNIKDTVKEIFNDPSVQNAANRWADTIALSFGKAAGSVGRIGITIADNLIGGIDGYLSKSKEYIKNRIISIFDVSAEISSLTGELYVAIADIFDVFSGPDAKGITADIIGVFSDGFLGAIDLGLQFVNNVYEMITKPVIDNVDEIKLAIENTLEPIRIVMDSMYNCFQQTFQKIFEVYDAHISPLFESLTLGLTSIVGVALDAYNSYIAPVLQSLAEKVDTVFNEHLQPTFEKLVEFLGTIADSLKALWETILVPLIEWIITNIAPVFSNVVEIVGGVVLELVGLIADCAGDIIDAFDGLIKFLTGVFTGNWKLAFQGLEKIGDSFFTAVQRIFNFINTKVLAPFAKWIDSIFVYDWTKAFGKLGEILNVFFGGLLKVWENIKGVFSGLITFINGVFAGNWRKAWEGIKTIFKNVFEGIGNIARIPINAIIAAFNAVISVINGLISKVNNIRFRITVPDWIPGIGGSWWGFNGFSIPTMGNIPYLAQGAYIGKNTPRLAVIGDNRHYGEFVAPEDKMMDMAMKAAREAAGSGVSGDELERIINNAVLRIVSALANMGFYVDGEEFARAMRSAGLSSDMRYNTVSIE